MNPVPHGRDVAALDISPILAFQRDFKLSIACTWLKRVKDLTLGRHNRRPNFRRKGKALVTGRLWLRKLMGRSQRRET
jgi:hypothetical protein